jgi:endoglucanase
MRPFTACARLLLAAAAAALTACGGGGGNAAVGHDTQPLQGAPALEGGADDSWTTIADEGHRFTIAGTQTVRYGAGSTWIEARFDGSGECSNGAFGSDPLYGVHKQ